MSCLCSFDSGCLPVTWADQNIEHDFNTRSFINLNNHVIDNFSEICEKLKDDLFLNKFITEPLLLYDPDINFEIKFAKSILNNFFTAHIKFKVLSVLKLLISIYN